MGLLSRALLACATAWCLPSVAAPRAAASPPPGARAPAVAQRNPTAHCNDGTYYYGPRNKRLACAHHRGVAEWLAPPPDPAPSRRSARAGAPRGATARCRDGSWSFVKVRKRACAGHRGVARWLGPPTR